MVNPLRSDRIKPPSAQMRTRLVIVLSIALNGVFLLGGSQARREDVGVFKTLIMRDDQGNARLVAGTRPDGSFGFGLLDRERRERLHFGIDADDRAALTLYDLAGGARIIIDVPKDGSSNVLMSNTQDKGSIALSVQANGSAGVNLTDREGQVRLNLGVRADGSPQIRSHDPNGKLQKQLLD